MPSRASTVSRPSRSARAEHAPAALEPGVANLNPPGEAPLGFLIATNFRLIRQILARRLTGQRLTPPQYGALQMLLAAPDLTLSEMARRAVADSPTLCRILDRLERRGLVQRSPGEKDRRCLSLRLTDRGRRTARMGRETGQLLERQLLGGFSQTEAETLRALLTRLLHNAMALCAEDPNR